MDPGSVWALPGAFRDAAELLKAGDHSAKFPIGSFPPRSAVRESLAVIGGAR